MQLEPGLRRFQASARRIRQRVRSSWLDGRELVSYAWHHPENRNRRARTVVRVVTWQVWQRVVRWPWTVRIGGQGGGDPLKLRVYPHNTSATGVLYCGLPDWADMRFLLDYMRAGDTFVDIGANVGVYTLLAASVSPEVEVVAFEPSTEAFRRLEENVVLNGLAHRVRLRRAAVGAEPGIGELTIGRDATNRVVDSRGARGVPTEKVRIETLAESLSATDRARVSLVKIDVEGLEAEVLRGSAPVLVERRPVLVIEPNDAPEAGRAVGALGYRPFIYEPAARELLSVAWDAPPRGRNLIAIADLDEVRGRLA